MDVSVIIKPNIARVDVDCFHYVNAHNPVEILDNLMMIKEITI